MEPLSSIIATRRSQINPQRTKDKTGGGAVAKAATKPKEVDRTPTDILRSEVNLLNLPFFALWDKDLWRRTITEFTDVEEREGTRLQIQWTVTGDRKLGYPGPFDRKVFRAIEHILTSQSPPLENPIRLGPFADIAGLLEFKKRKKGGYPDWVYESIRNAIKRIAAARASSKGTWTTRTKDDQGAVTKRYVEDGPFAIYARPFFAWQKLPDGTIADTNYLELGSWYLASLNDRYVRPLDFNYYKSFKTNTGPRLYELLAGC